MIKQLNETTNKQRAVTCCNGSSWSFECNSGGNAGKIEFARGGTS